MDIAARLLRTIASGQVDEALEGALTAQGANPDDALIAALATYLQAGGAASVYDQPAAFDEFISFGGNPPMYERTIAALHEVQQRVAPAHVIDIGCGDGRVTGASLASTVRRVDLLEPSRALLDAAAGSIARPGLEVRPVCATLTDHLAHSSDRWDLAQATFALHNLDAKQRTAAWEEMRDRTAVLAIVEFDVPDHPEGSDAHFEFLARSYSVGVSEYLDHPNVVQGFLMPVLTGQLDPSRPRYTHEQPIDAWCDELERAGFRTERTLVFDYWWSPATLIVAT